MLSDPKNATQLKQALLENLRTMDATKIRLNKTLSIEEKRSAQFQQISQHSQQILGVFTHFLRNAGYHKTAQGIQFVGQTILTVGGAISRIAAGGSLLGDYYRRFKECSWQKTLSYNT